MRYDKINNSNVPYIVSDSVIEIPITNFIGFKFFDFYSKYLKLDINWCYLNELKYIIDYYIRHEMPYLILFLHSFSFFEGNKNNPDIIFKKKIADRFDNLLKYLVFNKKIEFVTFDSLVYSDILSDLKNEKYSLVSNHENAKNKIEYAFFYNILRYGKI